MTTDQCTPSLVVVNTSDRLPTTRFGRKRIEKNGPNVSHTRARVLDRLNVMSLTKRKKTFTRREVKYRTSDIKVFVLFTFYIFIEPRRIKQYVQWNNFKTVNVHENDTRILLYYIQFLQHTRFVNYVINNRVFVLKRSFRRKSREIHISYLFRHRTDFHLIFFRFSYLKPTLEATWPVRARWNRDFDRFSYDNKTPAHRHVAALVKRILSLAVFFSTVKKKISIENEQCCGGGSGVVLIRDRFLCASQLENVF